MSAKVIQLRPTEQKRINKATIAQQAIPRALGALLQHGQRNSIMGATVSFLEYSFQSANLHITFRIAQSESWGQVEIHFNSERMLAFCLRSVPSRGPLEIFDGRAHVLFQRRGPWEGALQALSASDVQPIDFMKLFQK